MRKAASLLICLAICCFGQETTTKANRPDPKYFRLDFLIKELDGGKVVNSRNYSSSVATDLTAVGDSPFGEIRAEEKIPFHSENQVEQINVGVRFDVGRVTLVGDRVGLVITGAISSVAAPAQTLALPTTRETQMKTYALVPVRKPTLIFSADEPFSKGQLQVELTATPLN